VAMNLHRSGSFIGLAGMATTVFLYAYSAIVLPGLTTVFVLPSVWLLLFALSLAWFVRHPYRVLALPCVATAVWFAVMLA
jgi:hypothetical protein